MFCAAAALYCLKGERTLSPPQSTSNSSAGHVYRSDRTHISTGNCTCEASLRSTLWTLRMSGPRSYRKLNGHFLGPSRKKTLNGREPCLSDKIVRRARFFSGILKAGVSRFLWK